LVTFLSALLTLSLFFASSPGSISFTTSFAFEAARVAFSFFRVAGAVLLLVGVVTEAAYD